MAGRTDYSISAANFEWHSLVRDVARNAFLILLAFLIGLMGAFVLTRGLVRPEYTSSAMLAVNVKSDSGVSLSDLSLSQQMAEVLQEVFASDVLRKQTAQTLGRGSFDGAVSTSQVTGTNIIKVSVTAGDSRTAYDLLSAMLQCYPSVSEDVFANGEVHVVSAPRLARGATQERNIFITLIAGGLAAAFLMLLAILLLSFLRDTVKSERAFRERIDGNLLTSIPHEHKNRLFARKQTKQDKAVLITNPTAGFLFTESFQKLVTRISYLSRRHNYRIFLITSVSENEGKTSVITNIAFALAEKGKRVLLVDCDRRKPAVHKILDMTKREWRTATPVACGLRMYSVRNSGLYAAVNPVAAADDIDMMLSDEMNRFLQEARKRFDYVLLDTPPLAAATDAEALSAAIDATMLVVRTDCSYAADINDAIDVLSEAKASMLGCVLNDVFPVPEFLGGVAAADRYGEKDDGAADDGLSEDDTEGV